MKTIMAIVATVVLAVICIGTTSSQPVTTIRVSEVATDLALTMYVQGLEGGLELWAHNYNTEHPMIRVGVVKPVSDVVKAGAYLVEKDQMLSLNPRAIVSGKVLGLEAKCVIDGYQPLSGQKGSICISDAYLVKKVSGSVKVGLDFNGTLTEDKNPAYRAGIKFIIQGKDATADIRLTGDSSWIEFKF